jgi:hypothetical protein
MRTSKRTGKRHSVRTGERTGKRTSKRTGHYRSPSKQTNNHRRALLSGRAQTRRSVVGALLRGGDGCPDLNSAIVDISTLQLQAIKNDLTTLLALTSVFQVDTAQFDLSKMTPSQQATETFRVQKKQVNLYRKMVSDRYEHGKVRLETATQEFDKANQRYNEIYHQIVGLVRSKVPPEKIIAVTEDSNIAREAKKQAEATLERLSKQNMENKQEYQLWNDPDVETHFTQLQSCLEKAQSQMSKVVQLAKQHDTSAALAELHRARANSTQALIQLQNTKADENNVAHAKLLQCVASIVNYFESVPASESERPAKTSINVTDKSGNVILRNVGVCVPCTATRFLNHPEIKKAFPNGTRVIVHGFPVSWIRKSLRNDMNIMVA